MQIRELGEDEFYLCFYRVYFSNGHVSHHHVLIKSKPADDINVIDCDIYSYRLYSQKLLRIDKIEQSQDVYRGLIMDGESLLRRLKAQQNKTIQSQNQE